MANSVEFEIRPFAVNFKLGVIRLNRPLSLNALNLKMIERILGQLELWRMDQTIVAIWLEGAGGKAFCAGGDVIDVYKSLTTTDNNSSYASRYFQEEYALDYSLHCFPKPVICWGNGYVMGGGLGLMMASNYRVVTPTSKLSMPEISIGLYPDVGASYFLNQLEASVAKFLALTGYQVNATDACELGLATHYLMEEDKTSILDSLSSASMQDINPVKVASIIEQTLFTFSQSEDLPLLKPELTSLLPTIESLMSGDIANIYLAMSVYEPECEAMLKSKNAFLGGSPMSAHLIMKQLEWGKGQTLESVFARELTLSVQCCEQGDFKEGVRALLVDKDRQPKWEFGRISQVPEDRIMSFFESHQDALNPVVTQL